MNPESRPKSDQRKEIVKSFIHEMRLITKAIIAIRKGYIYTDLPLNLPHETANSLKDNVEPVSNHPILNSSVRVVPSEESSRNCIYYFYPWTDNARANMEPIEGVVTQIWPGMGILIKRGLDYARFVEVINPISGEPTCEITIIDPSENPE